jgi:hypothetical protein
VHSLHKHCDIKAYMRGHVFSYIYIMFYILGIFDEFLTCLFFFYFQIFAEATLVFPLLVAETFAVRYHATKVKAESDV